MTKAKEINDQDYTVLNLLAHSYRYKGDKDQAIVHFQEIVDKFPSSRRATSAQNFINQLNGEEGDDSNVPSGDNRGSRDTQENQRRNEDDTTGQTGNDPQNEGGQEPLEPLGEE